MTKRYLIMAVMFFLSAAPSLAVADNQPLEQAAPPDAGFFALHGNKAGAGKIFPSSGENGLALPQAGNGFFSLQGLLPPRRDKAEAGKTHIKQRKSLAKKATALKPLAATAEPETLTLPPVAGSVPAEVKPKGSPEAMTRQQAATIRSLYEE